MLLGLSTFAASQTDSVKARRHGLAPVLAARLRRLCWPLVVVVWRLCVVSKPGAWS